MSFSIGDRFRFTTIGESHGDGLGVVIEGVPAGYEINKRLIDANLYRRRSKSHLTTPRFENDNYEILSGILDGKANGGPITFYIKNEDKNSSDYPEKMIKPRPSHADYPAYVKYNGNNDIRGGGFFSGRLTFAPVIAGSIAMDILSKMGIDIKSRIKFIYNIEDKKLDYSNVSPADFKGIEEKIIPVLGKYTEFKIYDLIEKIRQEEDSVGGIVEVFAFNVPAGVGEPIYASLESEIAKRIFSVPGVNGLEFGIGFQSVNLKGSENNDTYHYVDGEIKTKTNNHGGILGGITTGMPIVLKANVKPTSSIGIEQETINLETKKDDKLKINGRHDPAIILRVPVVLETMVATAILDQMIVGGIDVFK